jgi:hypothetical protein
MCLDTITKIVEPTEEVVEAWKLFRKGSFFSWSNELTAFISDKIKLGRWNTAISALAVTFDWNLREPSNYNLGFHAYPNKDTGYRAWKVYTNGFLKGQLKLLKVKLRKVHTYGTQDGFDVIVAEEMFIPDPGFWAKLWFILTKPLE